VKRIWPPGVQHLRAVHQGEKAVAMCEFVRAKQGQGEHREAGSRKFFVRKIIRDRALPGGQMSEANLATRSTAPAYIKKHSPVVSVF